jgi:hypothetical protein
LERHEAYVQRCKLLQKQDQVPEVSAETIEAPTHHHIKSPALGIDQEGV